jgi:radical SAM superfamily enzyme YgiQ (UPF0313 family)
LNILFFTAPSDNSFVRLGRCGGRAKAGEKWPPVKLLFAAGAARQHAVVRLIDAEGILSPEQFIAAVNTFGPDLAVCEPTPGSSANDNFWAGKIKAVAKDCRILAIGAFPSAIPAEFIEAFSSFDYVIAGEAEQVISQLVRGSAPETTPSLWTCHQAATSVMPYADLDSLPYPAHDLLDRRNYFSPFSPRPFTVTETSRGCPYSCIFCNARDMSGVTPRFRSSANLSGELALLRQLGFGEVKFNDEIFTLDRDRTREIIAMIAREHRGLTWKCNTRADLLDEQLLTEMAGSGCRLIYIGVESATESILEYYRKKVPLEKLPEVVTAARKVGIKTVLHFMFGAPQETWETVESAISYACTTDPDYVGFNILTPYPGTQLLRDLQTRNLLPATPWDCLDQSGAAAVRTEALSGADLVTALTKANRSFYLRPSVLLRNLAELRHPRQVVRLVATAKRIMLGSKG